MAVETLDIKQVVENSNSTDIYEAVIKASRRARQILNERNYEKQMLLVSLNEEDDAAEVMIQTAEEREDIIHPVTVALEELLEGKLVIKYEKEQP